MTKLLFMLIFCLVFIEAQFSMSRSPQCPTPHIANGRMRMRPRARIARFSCSAHFELVGNRYATCRYTGWDVPAPVCVRSGCDQPVIEHGLMMTSHEGAWIVFYCFPGYQLSGSSVLYCDGHQWNATVPTCIADATKVQPPLSCDFESEDLCQWRQDELHDFDWLRLNMKTPSAFLLTGPSFDHTLGSGQAGHYMYIESTSKLENDSARLISPVYDGALTKNGCFSLFYHMFGKSIGGLKVYQIPESPNQNTVVLNGTERREYLLFEKYGNQGDFWYRNVSKLNVLESNFQIVIEGIRGPSFTSDIAIDDVAILQGGDCDTAAASAVTPPEVFSETCSGRCDIYSRMPQRHGECGCTANCVTTSNCCPDFFELCVFGRDTTDDDDDSPRTTEKSTDVPRTEKMIRTTTTTIAPTTTKTTITTTTSTTPAPTTAKSTTRVTTVKTTKLPTTVRTTTRTPATVRSTSKATTKVVTTTLGSVTTVLPRKTNKPTIKGNVTRKAFDAGKERMKQALESTTQRIMLVKQQASVQKSSSGSTAALVTTLFLAACVAAAALVALRSARGRAALAQLRGRATGDSEVRYLTRDHD